MSIHSEFIGELTDALSKAQGSMKPAPKKSLQSHLKTNYADLESVWESCRAALSANGLAVIQMPFTPEEGGGLGMETILSHSSGQWITSKFVMPTTKQDAWAIGSAATYARRYSLMAMVGICATDEDDDGVGAVVTEKLKAVPETDTRLDAEKLKLTSCKTMDTLRITFQKLSEGDKRKLEGLKNECIERLSDVPQ